VARVPLLVLGFVALVAGTLAGLARFGVPVPASAAGLAGFHGPLLLCGFFGAVIALERAVAIGQAWAYAGPLLAGVGALAAIAGHLQLAAWLAVAASGVLVAASLVIQRRQPALFTATLTAASACWCVGSLLWALGAPPPVATPWWFAFPVLTIAGERLELSRFLPPSRNAARLFAAISLALAVGLAFGEQRAGRMLFGIALAALAAWLLRHDIARRTVSGRGLTRYIALCLLPAYGWLAACGALIAAADALVPGSPARDAALHALGLGFVFSMVFGHAPIIVPAVLRVTLTYHPAFYAPLALLHGTLLLRVAGDALDPALARAGAVGNALALALFIATMVAAVVRGRRKVRSLNG
jgi:hypothetical protein